MVKWFDRIPVKGWLMGAIVAVIGAVLVFSAPGGRTCEDAGGLRHVYAPSRLHVLATCQTIRFEVVAWRHEHDDDYHVNGRVLDADAATWINHANLTGQHGNTVIEFVPGDPRPREFRVGMVLELQTTKVEDRGHAGWIEGHPVFSSRVLEPGTSSVPKPALVPPTEKG